MNKNTKKKKKGFTLIELVIVLAVLAIIAMIAIPNFTKVRNKALIDGDKRSAEQIEKITLMAIANEDIKITAKLEEYEIKFDNKTGKLTPLANANYTELLREVEKPQVPGSTGYLVQVDPSGAVGVGYLGGKPEFTGVDSENLAGNPLQTKADSGQEDGDREGTL